MINTEIIRKDFPMLDNKKMAGKPLVYLDNSATTFKPNRVIDAINDFYHNYTSNIHRGEYELSQKADNAYDSVRGIVGKLINCSEKEVIFTSGATNSLNIVAYSYGLQNLKEGDEILLTLAEHASNVLPWFDVAKRTGAVINYIPLDEEGRLTPEGLKSVISEKTKIVAFASVTNVLGFIADVKELCRIVHQYGAIAVVDGAQSTAHIKTDVRDWDCDFLAFSAHKMCGPSGVGVLYGKKEILDAMVPFTYGGGSNARFEADGTVILKDAPEKFESGTPDMEGVIGLGAAVKYISSVGLDNIYEHEKQLRDYVVRKIKELGNVEIYNEHGDTGIIALNVKDIFAQDAASYIGSQGIAVRSGNHCAKMLHNVIGVTETIRASFYFYNTYEDADRLVEALKNCTIENCIGIFF